MNDEASCLVDHHEVVVLQNDLERLLRRLVHQQIPCRP
jgi:hypothetical protein